MKRSLIVNMKKIRDSAKENQAKRQRIFQLAEDAEVAQELALEEMKKREEEFLARLGGKDEQKYRSKKDPTAIFDSLIACREHIYEHSLIDIPCQTLEQRMNLGKEVYEDEVDGQIEVKLNATSVVGEEWIPFNDHWEKIYPFNQSYKTKPTPCRQKDYCEGCQNHGERVYILRFKDKKHVYSGGTGKCLYWRFHDHSIGRKSKQLDKLTHRMDQKKGLRWDLMHKFYSDDRVYRCEFKPVENWLKRKLESCGFVDDGDGGK